MPLFYFHLSNSTGWTCDTEGRELEGVQGAREVAIQDARALIAADVLEGRAILMSSYVAIHDAEGEEVDRVGYDEVVTLT
ncbi:DUF6894 family protein [Croceicoccus hydrothermalis]|uniref:DUF6894 family protein n=1 Tax=Croceicoccus hydrothermalis TaxID=2867964 RepID=UPI001EFA9153|nr:hypothetical protein [Croceicoccus hydrothermalis]